HPGRQGESGGRAGLTVAASVGGAAIVLALAAVTSVQVGHWRNGIELWRHAIDATENNAVAHNDLAVLLAGRGEIEDAVIHLREALRIDPRYADAHYNLTNDLLAVDRIDEAAALSREELALWPADARTFV